MYLPPAQKHTATPFSSPSRCPPPRAAHRPALPQFALLFAEISTFLLPPFFLRHLRETQPQPLPTSLRSVLLSGRRFLSAHLTAAASRRRPGRRRGDPSGPGCCRADLQQEQQQRLEEAVEHRRQEGLQNTIADGCQQTNHLQGRGGEGEFGLKCLVLMNICQRVPS